MFGFIRYGNLMGYVLRILLECVFLAYKTRAFVNIPGCHSVQGIYA